MDKFKKNYYLLLFSCFFILINGLKCIALEEEFDDFEDIKLYAAQPKTLSVSNPKRVVVARPEIADVYSVSTNEVVLEPKIAGTTTLFIWDEQGQHSYRLQVFNEDLLQLKHHADSLLRELGIPGLQLKINEAEAKLVLTGEMNSPQEKERVLSALANVKDKILDLVTIKEERNLVKIDMQILEINRDDIKKLGLNYTDSTKLTDNASKAMNKITDMFATSRWTRAALDVTINHLVSIGKLKVLSRPKLVCLSGKEAEFMVGGQVPILTSTATAISTATNVTFKDFGIKLNIRPIVKNDENIFLAINTEISEVDKENFANSGQPSFLTRNTKTELYLKDEQSLVISGLIKNREANTVEKFPGMADIPILGMLFRSRNFQQNQTELVILLTPTIVAGSPVLEGKDISSGGAALSSFDKSGSPLFSREKEGKVNSSGLQRKYENKTARVLKEFKGKRADILDSYIDDIKSQIVSSIEYPSLARESRVVGTVKVRLRIFSDGGLKEALVVNSSGSELLDSSAILSIKKLAPFPSFPGAIERNEIAVDIPIVYS